MTKKFTTLQLFSLVDGRMSTNIDDIYDMLNHIFGDSFMTHQLPVIFDYLKRLNPQWFADLKKDLANIKAQYGNDFDTLITVITQNNAIHDIPTLTDPEKAGLGEFFSENSLLSGKSTKDKRDDRIDKILK